MLNSTYIVFDEDPRPSFCDLPVGISSVPTSQLNTFGDRFKASLVKITEDGIDMKRMRMVIDRDQRQVVHLAVGYRAASHLGVCFQLRSRLETNKGDTFSSDVIEDFVLGADDGSNLETGMNMMPLYDTLRTWTDQQWRSLLKQYAHASTFFFNNLLIPCRYYIDSPCVIVRGRPSAQLADKIEEDEKARVAAQIKRLGPQGLTAAAELLDKAKEANDAPIPPSFLTSFPVPSVSSISWIPVQSYQDRKDLESCHGLNRQDNSQLKAHIDADGSKLPFFVQFDHVEVCSPLEVCCDD